MTTSGQSSSGQTVGNNAAGRNNDPSTVYNHGGNNNTNQCTWMHQKVTENASSGSIGSGSSTAADDPFGTALTTWFEALGEALTGGLEDLPDQLHAQIKAASRNFKDPKSVVSTGISDPIGVFTALGDLVMKFAQNALSDTLTFVSSLLDDILNWLNTPITIPFDSELYQLIAHDQLTVLDLNLLSAASSLCEIMLLGEDPAALLIEEAIVKFCLFTVSGVLTFTESILGAVDG